MSLNCCHVVIDASVEVVLLTTLRSTDSSTAGSAQSSTVVTIEVARATGVRLGR